ncbi:hypothetical protein [Dongia deserti]|uniref:hypothetical protein n=1 Tax=Dongia deserti TaxID=2268030 RepID=UPI000E651DFC|nr:hypothetical protein [Dongia deserti]
MDRNGRGKPPPGESSAFDLSKKSEADVAAEMAARMARWREARKRAGEPARAPPVSAPTVQPSAMPSDTPAAAQPARADQPPLPELDVVMVTRIDRTLRIAAQARAPHAERTRARLGRPLSSYGLAFRSVLDEGPNQNAIGMTAERSVGEASPPAGMPRSRAQAFGTSSSTPLHRALENRIRAAGERTRAFGAGTRAAGSAGWRVLRAALTFGIDATLRQARALGVAAHSLGVAVWCTWAPALANSVQRAQRHIRARVSAAWGALRPTLRSRIGEAQRRAVALGAAALTLSGAACRSLATALARYVDQTTRRMHAAGVTARQLAIAGWQAPASRPVMAGVALIATVIAAWCLMQPHVTVTPGIAGTPAISMPQEIAGAPIIEAPVSPPVPAPAQAPPSARPMAEAPSAETPPAPEAAEPEDAIGFLAPKLKPRPPLPTLTAYLKPTHKAAAPDRQKQPEPPPQEKAPLPPLPEAEPPPATPDDLRKRNDPRSTDIMLDQMFSDPVGRKLRRKRVR